MQPAHPSHTIHNEEGKPASTITSKARIESSQRSIETASRLQSPAISTTISTNVTTPHHHHHHTDSTMSRTSTSSTASTGSAHSEMTYYLVPNLQALDTSACELDASAHAWVQPTIIDDDDLTFGGKSLSAWYEEDRRRLSHSDEEEASRGRERVRRSHHSSRSGRK